MHICEWCDRALDDVEYRLDPFQLEVYADRVFSWMCGDCEYERHREV